MSAETELLQAICTYLDGMEGGEAFLAPLLEIKGPHDPALCSAVPASLARTNLPALASDRSRALVEMVVKRASELNWIEPYEGDSRAGAGFAGNAHATAIAGPWVPLHAEGVGCGFFIIGQGAVYEEHAHEPDEIYVPIAGRGLFRCETYGELDTGPDRVIAHPSWIWHSIETPDSPVLILWVWTGSGLETVPVFRGNEGETVAIDL